MPLGVEHEAGDALALVLSDELGVGVVVGKCEQRGGDVRLCGDAAAGPNVSRGREAVGRLDGHGTDGGSMSRTLVTLRVNGRRYEVAVRPSDTLALALRDGCGLIGTKIGCDMGTCGCCTVLLDGRPSLSCLTLALEAEGREITTVEGLAGKERLHPVQEAFATCGGSQCGYCTPGFVMTSVALLREDPAPGREKIKEAISGNLCRCTGYVKIIEAIERAGEEMRGAGAHAPEPAGETVDAS